MIPYGRQTIEEDDIQAVVDVAKERNIPIRVGVNSGSLEKELVEKYIVQMQYYKKALEMITDKEVKEIYIYSSGLGKAVSVYSPEFKLF